MSELIIVGEPDSKYQISISSSLIDSSLPDVKEYLRDHHTNSLTIDLSLRKCVAGESFLLTG